MRHVQLHKSDCLYIPVIALVGALLTEFITWFFIYRTVRYQKLKALIEKAGQKVAKQREHGGAASIAPSSSSGKKGGGVAGSGGAAGLKRADKDEKDLQRMQQQMHGLKMFSQILSGIVLFSLYNICASSYESIVVAKLPFEPLGFFQNITHRGLLGRDATDCSFAFLYMLAAMTIKGNLQKVVGSQAPVLPPGIAQSPFDIAALEQQQRKRI